jgi:nucleotide-binding universal stress UspA family protein
MMNRILVAIDDSSPALAAAALAIQLARAWSAELNVVAVVEAGLDDDAILNHVDGLAAAAGVAATTTAAHADHPFEALLATAHRWQADLIVMGHSDKGRPGRPHVGSQTEHLLEFTDIPVLVVPTPAD